MGFSLFKSQSPQITPEQKIPHKRESLQSLWRLVKLLLNNLEFEDVSGKVVNSILDELGYMKLGYHIIVLALINKNTGFLERITISETPDAKKALALTPVPFKDIRIPLNDPNNFGIKALKEQKVYRTDNWYDLLRPVYTSEQAETIQKAIGIKSSLIFPLTFKGESIGVLIFSMNKDYEKVTDEENDLLEGFVDLVGLTVQNSLLYTSLRNTTSQLQIANNKLRELDRLKDEFVSLASHELRTPLTAISSYLYMVIYKSMDKLPDRTGRYLTRAYLSTERLISLVNDMLNVSRIESGRIEIKPRSFNIAELVKEVVGEVKPKADENKVQVLVLDNRPPPVFADLDKIHQVLLNLLGNAIKFTRVAGTVTVSFFSDGKVVDVIVKDNGVGISKDEQSKLFQKFGRLDSSYLAMGTNGGTGLGLFISKRLIELMHGKIWVTSEGLNKGSTFYFSLPIATQEVLSKVQSFTVKSKDGEAKGLEPVML